MGPHTENYVWGKFPVPPDAPWFEPLTMLTAIAAVTTRVRLATGILIAPLRPAAFLAKQVATLDQISGGRVDLGVGTGWQREEYDAQGLAFEQRGQLLDDTLAACTVLWRDTPAAFDDADALVPTTSTASPSRCRPAACRSGSRARCTPATSRASCDYGDGLDPDHGRDGRGHRGRRRSGSARRARPRAATRRRCRCRRRCAWRWATTAGPTSRASMASVPELVAAGATDVHRDPARVRPRPGRRRRDAPGSHPGEQFDAAVAGGAK